MGIVHIGDVRPGMVLAEDAVSLQGKTLSPKGAQLDDLAIQTLAFCGLTEVRVDGHDQDSLRRKRLAALDPARVEAAGIEAGQRLAASDPDHPATRELRRLLTARLAVSGPTAPPSPRLAAPAPSNGRKRPSPSRVVSGTVRLASPPDLVLKVLEALNDPRMTVNRLAGLIGKDQSLCAKLLKLVNSSLYGFPEPVDNIGRAVSVVGARRIVGLVLGVALIDGFWPLAPELLDMRSFWEHNLGCAMIARRLAQACGHPNEEQVFVAGLLHDIGRLVMLIRQPELSAQALAQAWQARRPLDEAERDVWGFDHAHLGGELLNSWKFPPVLVRAVRHHHALPGAEPCREAALVHLADVTAQVLELGRNGSPLPPALSAEAWEDLGLPISALGAAGALAESQLAELSHTLLSGRA